MNKARKIRLKNSLWAIAGAILISAILILAKTTGRTWVSHVELAMFIIIALSGNISIVIAIATGFSEKFIDGSLSALQMYWSATMTLISLMILTDFQEHTLLLLLLITMFGVFRFTVRQFIYYGLYSITGLALASIINLQYSENITSLDLLITWCVFSLCLFVLSSLCSSMTLIKKHLHTKNESLKQALQAKSLFLANMSHEIRTPMNGVIGMLDLLTHSNLNKEQMHQAQIASTSADALLTIIDDILDISKIEAGKLLLECTDFDLEEQIGGVAKILAHKAQKKGVELVLNMTDLDTPVVKGDQVRIRQILLNIIGNAIKFTTHGEVCVTAKLSPARDGFHTLTCEVKDTGIGICEEQRTNIFKSFSQVDASTTRHFGGTGLGLTISKNLCAMMNGGIQVASELNKGSCFTFHVQLKTAHTQPPQTSIHPFKNRHILLVDSQLSSAQAIKYQLQYWGAKVTHCFDTHEACMALNNTKDKPQHPPYSLIFIDRYANTLNKTTLSYFIRTHFMNTDSVNPSKPYITPLTLVLMTSIDTQEETNNLHEQGFDTFFPKPATPSDLLAILSFIKKTQDPLSDHINSAAKKAEKLLADDVEKSVSKNLFKILVVEDNHINREVITLFFEEWGLSYETASDGQEALEKLMASAGEKETYHMILMDCQMPMLDGYQTTREIRLGNAGSIWGDIPIIALTANAMMGDKDKCIASGMDDYLTKPIDATQLKKIIKQYLPQVTIK